MSEGGGTREKMMSSNENGKKMPSSRFPETKPKAQPGPAAGKSIGTLHQARGQKKRPDNKAFGGLKRMQFSK